MGWIAHTFGWKQCFWLAGLSALALGAVWFHAVHNVNTHPRVSPAELELIERGGGLANLDAASRPLTKTLTWPAVRWLLGKRMLVGIYLGQYCITTLTWFFLSWFPIYLS